MVRGDEGLRRFVEPEERIGGVDVRAYWAEVEDGWVGVREGGGNSLGLIGGEGGRKNEMEGEGVFWLRGVVGMLREGGRVMVWDLIKCQQLTSEKADCCEDVR